MTEDEMVGWHHQLNGHEFEQTPRDAEGQGSLACCSLWGCKQLDTTEVTEHRQYIKNQRRHFGDKDAYSQSCGLSSSHVQM